MALSWLKDIATILGALVALVALIKGILEYVKQGAQKRAEHFLTMRKRLKDNEVFNTICYLLERDDSKLLSVPFKDKRDFLGLFEEVAIAMNSGLIRPSVAHYMFGYYALRCWRSENFWQSAEGVNRKSMYWLVFKDFAEQMQEMEKALQEMEKASKFERRHFRF